MHLLLLIVLFGALIRTKKMMEYLSFCLLLALLNASQITMIDFLAFIPFSVFGALSQLKQSNGTYYLKASLDLLEGVMMLFSTYLIGILLMFRSITNKVELVLVNTHKIIFE